MWGVSVCCSDCWICCLVRLVLIIVVWLVGAFWLLFTVFDALWVGLCIGCCVLVCVRGACVAWGWVALSVSLWCDGFASV